MNNYIIDAEVHLMHPESTKNNFAKGTNETVRKAIHEHTDYPKIKSLMSINYLFQSMEINNIRHCHIMGMPWRHKPWNDANNDYIEKCVKEHPTLLSGFYIPHLDDINKATKEISNLNKDVFLGVKLLPTWQGRKVNDSELFPLYNMVRKRNMFLMVHTDQLTQSINGDTPQKLLDMVQKFPDLKVLAPHMGGLLGLYELLPKFSSMLKNMTYIASSSATMEFIKFASEIVPDKILYGTDFPFNHCHDQKTQIDKLNQFDLSDEKKNKILFKNAERIFNYKR